MVWLSRKLTASERRRAVIWGSAAAVSLACIALAIWLPVLIERRIAERLEPHQLRFQADVGLSLGGVHLEDVHVLTSEGAELARVGSVDVAVSLWGARPKQLSVADAQIDVGLDWLKTWRARREKSAAASSAGPAVSSDLPQVELADVKVRVHDQQGVLLGAEGIEGKIADGAFQASVDRVFLGADPSDVIEVTDAEIAGTLNGRSPRIARVSAKNAVLRWNSAATARPASSTRSRVQAFRDALRVERPSQAPPATAASSSSSRFADDASIVVESVRVLDVAEDQKVTLLDKLRISALAQGQQRWRLQGEGAVHATPGSQGGVQWDLKVAPQELTVEGRVRLDDVALSLFAPALPPLPFYELDRTRLHADVQIAGNGLASASVKGSLGIRDLAFASDGLAETPVGPFSFEADGEALWTPGKRELSGVEARVRTGKTTTLVSGTLAWPPGSYRVDLVADMQKARCSDVLHAVPAGLLGELASTELGGEIAAKVTLHVDAEELGATVVDFDIADKCRFLAAPELLDLKRFERPFVHTVFEPDGTVFEMETGPGSAAWTPIELISPFMTQAVIAHEDGRFLSHHGFAEPEIAHALARNLEAKAFRFGASTITMQLVKNLFLHRDKLLSRKVQEAFIVWYLEEHWDKRRILEMYLNIIEYGPAIYGIRNAALHYFGALPLDLTPAQCAFLASILPNPKGYHDQYEKRALSSSMKNRMGTFLQHMFSRQRIDQEALDFGLEELNDFRFYDPDKPPPAPRVMRGQAQPLPFIRPGLGFDPWSTVFDSEESGSFR